MNEDQQQIANLQSSSFAEPFGFRGRLRLADTRIDFIPVLDMIVLAMLVSLLFTRFVSLPGVRVDLPATEMRMQHSQQTIAVLTIGNDGMLFFNGALFESGMIQQGFERYIEDSDGSRPVLLVKADYAMEMQDFLHLCELAKAAGFVQVQLAGKKENTAENMLPDTLRGPGES